MYPTTLFLAAVLILASSVASMHAPDKSAVLNPLTNTKEKCSGYCSDPTCELDNGCCCFGKFQFCYVPKKGESC
ncbi:hypothetical protein B0H12DRAFT_87369 [Mycena haematopus]|nr:hypothetical protein B0H12DRAFT_87369 [Mycena haematopus]